MSTRVFWNRLIILFQILIGNYWLVRAISTLFLRLLSLNYHLFLFVPALLHFLTLINFSRNLMMMMMMTHLVYFQI